MNFDHQTSSKPLQLFLDRNWQVGFHKPMMKAAGQKKETYLPVMKWFIILVVITLAICVLERFHSRAMRRAWMWNARISLSTACQDFVKTGNVPSESNSGRVYSCTNVFTIGGTNYSCAIALNETAFGGIGTLAITTNQVFVWSDKSSGPRIIDNNYWPPFFSRGF